MNLRKVSIIILMIIMICILLFVRGKIIENKFLLDKINGLDSMIFEAEDSINLKRVSMSNAAFFVQKNKDKLQEYK